MDLPLLTDEWVIDTLRTGRVLGHRIVEAHGKYRVADDLHVESDVLLAECWCRREYRQIPRLMVRHGITWTCVTAECAYLARTTTKEHLRQCTTT